MMRPKKESNSHGEAIKATHVRYNDQLDECTLHPAHPKKEKRTTEWMTAKRGTYVSLAVWR